MKTHENNRMAPVDILESAADLVCREDWRECERYPSMDSDNSTMWAWEYLRRNRRFADNYDHLQSLTDQEDFRNRIRVAYGVSSVEDPCFPFEKIAQTEYDDAWGMDVATPDSEGRYDSKSIAHGQKFHFDANIANVLIQYFPLGHFELASESPSNPQGRVESVITHSAMTSMNHVLVRLSLDGNIDEQIASLRAQLRSTRDLPHSTQENRVLMGWVENKKGGRSAIGCSFARQKLRPNVNHLHQSLRCMDALATLAPTMRDFALLVDNITQQFNLDLTRAAKPLQKLAEVSRDPFKPSEIITYLNYGIRYVLDGSFTAMAATDFKSQLAKYRSVVKNKRS